MKGIREGRTSPTSLRVSFPFCGRSHVRGLGVWRSFRVLFSATWNGARLAMPIVDGEHVTWTGRKHFLVRSRSQEGHHTVEWCDDSLSWRCSCTGFNVRKSCRHVAAIERWEKGEATVSE